MLLITKKYCQPLDKNTLPSGLSVADACDQMNSTQNSIDRLVNYNKPEGWECWAPM